LLKIFDLSYLIKSNCQTLPAKDKNLTLQGNSKDDANGGSSQQGSMSRTICFSFVKKIV